MLMGCGRRKYWGFEQSLFSTTCSFIDVLVEHVERLVLTHIREGFVVVMAFENHCSSKSNFALFVAK